MKGGFSSSQPFQRVDLRRWQVGLQRSWKAGEQGQQGISQTSLWPFLAPFLGSVPSTNLRQRLLPSSFPPELSKHPQPRLLELYLLSASSWCSPGQGPHPSVMRPLCRKTHQAGAQERHSAFPSCKDAQSWTSSIAELREPAWT